MKIFYGVQGTGNGHITRARVMAKELQNAGIETVFKFTGRHADKFFDMDVDNEKFGRVDTFKYDAIVFHKIYFSDV